MKKTLKTCISFLLAFTLALAGGISASAAESGDGLETINISVVHGQTEARKMLDMINTFRTGNDAWYWDRDDSTRVSVTDLQPMVYDYELEKAAMQRAVEIAVCLSHTRPNGESCFTGLGAKSNAENIAAGSFSSAKAVFEAWQENDKNYEGQGHRRNMLSYQRAVGIGYVYYDRRHFWVQEFGPASPSSSETPANDSPADEDISILTSNITETSVEPVGPGKLSLKVGESQALPAVKAYMTINDSYPKGVPRPVNAPITWNFGDSSAISADASSITGTAAGQASLTASALGKTTTIAVDVTPAPLTDCTMDVPPESCIYDGSAKEPAVTLSLNGRTLTPGTDYTVSYFNNIKPGTATVTVTGKGNYFGELSADFRIECASHQYQETATREASCEAGGEIVYTCALCSESYTEAIPAAGHTIVTDNASAPTCVDSGLTEGSHCSSCGKIIKPQTAVPRLSHVPVSDVLRKASPPRDGQAATVCQSCHKQLGSQTIYAPESIILFKTDYTYNKRAQKPSVTVRDSQGAVIPASQYKVTYPAGCKNVGTYTVRITFNSSRYSGTMDAAFTISPKGTSLSKLTAGSKGFTARWKKQTAQTSGYQLQYATGKSFKNAGNTWASKSSSKSKKITKLKAKKKYYVRIRTYKTVKINGKQTRLYSAWSKAKTVKTKK